MAEKDFIRFEILSTCKGGGYLYCRTNPPHPKRNSKGLYPLHRVLAENKIGRMLAPGEQVHHINGDKADNSLDNLDVMTISDHARHHAPKAAKVSLTCPACGSTFSLKPHQFRLRAKRSESSIICCSRSCSVKMQHRKKS